MPFLYLPDRMPCLIGENMVRPRPTSRYRCMYSLSTWRRSIMLYRGCSVDYKTSQPRTPPQHKTVTHPHHRPDQTQLVSVPPRLRDLIGVPFGRAPVQRLARVDQVVEGTHCLLHGR